MVSRCWLKATPASLALVSCVACNQAELQQAPDAGVDACVARTVAFCDAAAPDAQSCVGNPSDASDLAGDAAFPVGCTANVIGTTRDPITGVCKSVATCTCEGDDASTRWVCSP